MTNRRQFVQTLGSITALGALSPFAAFAQTLDTARVVVGFPPGGTADVMARRVADRLPAGGYVKTAGIVDNKSGAGGRIAVETVKSAAPDGGTLLLTPHSVLTVFPGIYPKLSYKPFEDLVPVSLGATLSHALAVGPAVPANVKTVADFLAWAKANPKDASYGSPAAGSIPHFIGALLSKNSGIDLRHVPYRGSIPGVTDTVGGQIAAMITPVGDFLPQAKTGKLRILATSGPKRTPFTPNVPTFSEQGFDYIKFDEWYGFYAPARTPAPVVEAASVAINKALQDKAVIENLATFGLIAGGSTPAELDAMTHEEFKRWAPIVKQIGFTAES
ncbi:Bug family tripartite tricarboxylate transporter substrate binding protein [Paracidovorax wautersii]|uniref:Tripartite-type tricarboxylate transporter, receptor component TctC n=1 Tax=Paracidovorax wautersii TaxID=1177982 RepID=A0A1I1ZGK5_9BURK|nr:Bug family tripartite tricarboxylate transporter substrate binding protein [Paracidovorax wautersii]SFE29693.1 Tripartite-type tricarboxylate transporter, receptor component TctC [Paracidovorax wautersii]